MNTAPVAKAHFVLGGVHIDIDQCGIELQVEHKSRVTTVKQHVAVCLAHRMGDKAIANIATIHIEMLQVRLTARKSRQGDPAPQAQTDRRAVDEQRIFHKRRATDCRQTALLFQLTGSWL